MNHIQKFLLSAGLSLGLIGCSNPNAETKPANSSVEAETNLAVTEITWEDLMPEGEDELLESLYVEFYEEFERKMAQNSTTLAEAASQETDMSSLIEEGSDADTMNQIGTFNVVKELNGQRIRVPGYVVPFDFNANSEYNEFLVVPYFGACLHTPPPPPNQIILVKSAFAAKIDNIYEPFWLEGTLKTGEFLNDLGNSAYELDLSKIEPYEY
ncbi:MAG: DUF3299 domain-containing protein [Litorimonas sp.]